jgi:tryptophanyl-tRNA synthetase
MYCCIVDWHALTSLGENPAMIGRNCREIAKDYIAAGIDPERSPIFIQSHVKEHAELHLLFSMMTPLGWLERVPTYKEKRQLHTAEREPYGLLGYPVLQAADILLYKPYGVPVGKDQAPHLELSREIGRRFNNLYGHEVFPEFVNIIGDIPVMLGTDGRKMSKSYDNAIYISDTEDETATKIKNAFTTPTKIKKTDPGVPENCAVCQLLKVYSPTWQTQWDEDRSGLRGCMQNKKECTEVVNEVLRPMRARRNALGQDEIEAILRSGAERARAFASQTMVEVREVMGLR